MCQNLLDQVARVQFPEHGLRIAMICWDSGFGSMLICRGMCLSLRIVPLQKTGGYTKTVMFRTHISSKYVVCSPLCLRMDLEDREKPDLTSLLIAPRVLSNIKCWLIAQIEGLHGLHLLLPCAIHS